MKSYLAASAATFGLLSLFALPNVAQAQVAEVRVGINEHDVQIFGLGSNKGKENSVAINGEIVFEEPEFLKWALTPQPYIGGTINVGPGTSYGGAGLLWRQTFGERFYGDFSFGLVVHDGTLEVDRTLANYAPPGGINSPADFAFALDGLQNRFSNEIEFGSRILFREQIALGVRVNERWAVEGFLEHLSHGKIWTDAPNEGLDVWGFRAAYRFD